MNQIIPQNTSTIPIAMSALIEASTNLPPTPTLAAERVEVVCNPGLVADGTLVSLIIADNIVASKVPSPTGMLVADDAAFVVALMFMLVRLAVPTASPEDVAESFAPAPHFSSKLPIGASDAAKKQSPAPIGRPSASRHAASE